MMSINGLYLLSKPLYVQNDQCFSYIPFFTMPTKEHEEYQGLRCVMCLTKCKQGKLNHGHKIFIQKYVYQKYFDDEDFLPKSICSGCQVGFFLQRSCHPENFQILNIQIWMSDNTPEPRVLEAVLFWTVSVRFADQGKPQV